jgi:tetratricopeptide (TPR) repeat protein
VIRAVLAGWDQLMIQAADLNWLQRALRSCGLEVEAFALQARTARQRRDEREWEALVRSVLRNGDVWWARALLDEAGVRSRSLQMLGIEAALALGDASDLISAWTREHRDESALDAAVGWWVRNGRVDRAEALARETAGLALWRARFAIWRGQPAAARPLLEQLPSTAQTRTLEAVALVQEGRLAEAETQLRTLVDRDEVRGEAGTWLATVLRRQQRYAEAAQVSETASHASPTFNLVARLERELAVRYERIAEEKRANAQATSPRRGPRSGESQRTIAELEHATVLYSLGLRPEDHISKVEEVIDRFGGNHTEHLTTVEDGTLRSYRPPLDPRFLGANIQLVLWTRGAEATRTLYRQVAPQVDDHPLFRIYHGELELWLGAYEDAARIFRAVLENDTRVLWAWIGLGASALLQGHLVEAQRIWSEGLSRNNFVGPTLYVYRGECYRRQGEPDLARRDLEVAVRDRPERLSAWINLALLDEEPRALEQAIARCTAFAPLLMEALDGTPAEKLEKVLHAMRGNRRSTPMHISYHLWDRIWRRAASGT